MRLEETSVFRAKGENPFLATSPTVGQVLLASKPQLEQLLLRDPGVHLPACERGAVRAGEVDRRVLAALEFLSVSGLSPTVSAAGCGHTTGAPRRRQHDRRRGGRRGGHLRDRRHSGRRARRAGLGHRHRGAPAAAAAGHDEAGADRQRDQLPGTDNTVTLPGYHGLIHVAFASPGAARGRGARAAAVSGSPLTPSQWLQLISQLGEIPEPNVSSKPSAAAIPDPGISSESAGAGAGGSAVRSRSGSTRRGLPPTARAVNESGDDHASTSSRTPPAAASRAGGRAPGPPRPVSPPPRSVGRWVAAGALVVVVAAVAYIVFFSGGGASYKFELENDSQLVLGDQVEVGGVPVGNVTGIALTHNYHAALITIHIEGSLVPLHRGTTAQVRVPSLTTVAGRYVALSPGPNNAPALPAGSTLPAGSAQGTTDLDQLFDTLNPRTRKGLQEYFVGEAEAYAGASQALGTDVEYFGPFLASANHIFAELSKDQRTFTNFLVYSAKALTTLAAHREELTNLVSNGDQGLRSARRRTGQPAAGGRTAARHAGAGQPRVRAAALHVRRAAQTGDGRGARHQDARAAVREADAAREGSGAGAAQPQHRAQPAGAEQRPHRQRARDADARAGARHRLAQRRQSAAGIGAGDRLLRALRPRPGGLRAHLRHERRLLRRQRPVRAPQPRVRQLQARRQQHADADHAAGRPAGTAHPRTAPLPRVRRDAPPADGSAPFTDEGKLDCDPSQVP